MPLARARARHASDDSRIIAVLPQMIMAWCESSSLLVASRRLADTAYDSSVADNADSRDSEVRPRRWGSSRWGSLGRFRRT
jgi:hypothetical protein